MSQEHSPQPTRIVLSLSIGLVAALVLHAFTLATAQRAMPHVEKAIMQRMVDEYPGKGGINFDENRSSDSRPMNALPTNAAARDEVKRAPAPQQPCVPCNQVVRQPARPAPVQPNVTPKPAPTVKAKATTPRYSISLFVVHDDAESQRVLKWFNEDPQLSRLRSKCDFQVFTKDNPLYKSRYASQVPVDKFPAIMFLDPTGGSVYFASRGMIPLAPEFLHGEMESAYRLQKEITQAAKPTQSSLAIGESLGSLIMAMSNADQEDCADGNCKPKEPFWKRPLRDNDGEKLFPGRNEQSIEGMLLNLVFRPGETAFLIVIVCAIVIVLVYFIKRGGP